MEKHLQRHFIQNSLFKYVEMYYMYSRYSTMRMSDSIKCKWRPLLLFALYETNLFNTKKFFFLFLRLQFSANLKFVCEEK